MPRPRKCRRVGRVPVHTFYKPQGVPLEGLKGLTLTVEGLEALRLSDAEGMEQAAASERMGVSRPTFSRILAEARSVVARALSSGWALHIEGGHYRVAENGTADPPPPGGSRGRGRGRGRRRGPGGST
ncbi:MAG: DUF134 domain-containing protein [Desulfobacteraceae bacterium]|nr:DUF134 domain-containing protein [Desulfobacteraceae bacterium]